jgi:hypothetical protein
MNGSARSSRHCASNAARSSEVSARWARVSSAQLSTRSMTATRASTSQRCLTARASGLGEYSGDDDARVDARAVREKLPEDLHRAEGVRILCGHKF